MVSSQKYGQFFSYFIETYIVGTHLKCLTDRGFSNEYSQHILVEK